MPGNTNLKLATLVAVRSLPTRKKPRATGKSTRRKKVKKRKTTTGSKPERTIKPSKPRTPPRLTTQKKTQDATFIYECVRPGCGYRIWREEKSETGHLRFNIKCPKCHFQVFKCLGREEDVQNKVPTSQQAATLDFNTSNPVGLESN